MQTPLVLVLSKLERLQFPAKARHLKCKGSAAKKVVEIFLWEAEIFYCGIWFFSRFFVILHKI